MQTEPFWLAQSRPTVAARDLDHVDIAVIGAGITGCACAAALAREGKRVRVYDARGVGEPVLGACAGA